MCNVQLGVNHNQELQIHHNLVGRLVLLQWPLYFIAQGEKSNI